MRDIDEETTEGLKRLDDLNLKALADGFAKVLSENVGGTFDVALTKLEHTNPGFINDKILISFLVKDENGMVRYSQHHPSAFSSAR